LKHFNLPTRLVSLSALFTLELVFITVSFDGAVLLNKGGLIAWLGLSGAWLLRGIVAFAALFVLIAVLQIHGRSRDTLNLVSADLEGVKAVSPVWLAIHLTLLALFGLLARILFSATISGPAGTPIALLWLVTGVTAIATGACIFIPLRSWQQLLRTTGNLWLYALATSIAACLLGACARSLWASAAGLTFFLVKAMLTLVLPGVFTNPSTASIGTREFHVEIAPQCSGLEGAALILGFCTLWLWLLRREFRFPHALIIAPFGVAALFFLNAVRIAVLILVGNAGAPDIALGGFHSQAGWIAFNAIAIALMPATRRVPWITVGHSGSIAAPAAEENPAAPYLVPFLLILAAAMVSRAASAGFEWLYPLRLVASGAALWTFRAHYRKLDWRFGWQAPAIGALVCALWLAGDWLSGIHPQNPLVPNSDPSIALAQKLWLALRLLSAIVTVPIAEELAFRGYLIRRIISADFEQLSPRTFTAASLIISSFAFGLLHGQRWIAGTIAGLLYAALLIRRGRIGDAVIAHATTTGLLAASVIVTGQWNLS
jgi:exosortase E/protease (VPEID-CTERM system)